MEPCVVALTALRLTPALDMNVRAYLIPWASLMRFFRANSSRGQKMTGLMNAFLLARFFWGGGFVFCLLVMANLKAATT